jgi:hypothetical protein
MDLLVVLEEMPLIGKPESLSHADRETCEWVKHFQFHRTYLRKVLLGKLGGFDSYIFIYIEIFGDS